MFSILAQFWFGLVLRLTPERTSVTEGDIQCDSYLTVISGVVVPGEEGVLLIYAPILKRGLSKG